MRELGLKPCQTQPWRHSLTEAGDRVLHGDTQAGNLLDELTESVTGQTLCSEIVTAEILGIAVDSIIFLPPLHYH